MRIFTAFINHANINTYACTPLLFIEGLSRTLDLSRCIRLAVFCCAITYMYERNLIKFFKLMHFVDIHAGIFLSFLQYFSLHSLGDKKELHNAYEI